LLFFTPLFYYLPIPVLAAIIIYSIRNLFDLGEMRKLWNLAPKEFTTLIITFVFTLFAGLQYGIAGGVLLSLVFVFWRAARPHLAELGRVPGTNAFRNRLRFEEAEVDPAILLVRFDAELYFGNAEYFRDRMEALVCERGAALHVVIIDGHTINDIDTSGLFVLTRFLETLEKQNVELYLCGMIGPVRDKLYSCGLMERMGAAHNFLSIQSALDHLENNPDDRGWDAPAVQHG
jgi:SulP family sulfate permease